MNSQQIHHTKIMARRIRVQAQAIVKTMSDIESTPFEVMQHMPVTDALDEFSSNLDVPIRAIQSIVDSMLPQLDSTERKEGVNVN